ncbi:MAG: hypothetical protein ACFN4H_04515 [Prevotella sp.]
MYRGRKGYIIQVRERCYSSPRMMQLGLEDDIIQARKWRNMQWRTV